MIKAALQQPIKTIASNAGQEGSLIVGRLLEKYAEQDHMGYNAATNEFVDMFAAGVVDPVLVTKQALTDAGSVATLLFTSEAAIVEVLPCSDLPLTVIAHQSRYQTNPNPCQEEWAAWAAWVVWASRHRTICSINTSLFHLAFVCQQSRQHRCRLSG